MPAHRQHDDERPWRSDRVIIATTDNTARFHIISRSDITTPAQLKGKRLGYTEYGAITQLMAIVFAQKMGWNPDRDISLMADGTAFDVLAKGREDAFVGDEILQAMAAKLGYRDLLDLFDLPYPARGIRHQCLAHVAARSQGRRGALRQSDRRRAGTRQNEQSRRVRVAGKMVQYHRPRTARAHLPEHCRPAAQTVPGGRRGQRSDGDLQVSRAADPPARVFLRRQFCPGARPKRLHRRPLQKFGSAAVKDSRTQHLRLTTWSS